MQLMQNWSWQRGKLNSHRFSKQMEQTSVQSGPMRPGIPDRRRGQETRGGTHRRVGWVGPVASRQGSVLAQVRTCHAGCACKAKAKAKAKDVALHT